MGRVNALLAMCAGILLHGAVLAGSAADEVAVADAYARAVPPGQANSAAFMLMQNSAAVAHAVVTAASSVSAVAELHTHTMSDGMMQMRQVARIEIPAGGEARLQPGGLHVMLIGLHSDLAPGSELSLTLTFEDGSSKQIRVPVRRIAMKMMPHKMEGMQHGKMQH
ncbi:MAG: copper chaperone PCu(A)C [Gammaproteobacteria bacterium]|nr:copper chaperone PCu(A)C [Gammaproteobacteria bacterium]